MSSTQVTKAVHFAYDAHFSIDHRRKYSGEPYIIHPIAVAKLVGEFTADLEMVQAAYLHDTIEDVPRITPEIIIANFGESVGELVIGMTKDTYPDTMSRVEKQTREALRLSKTSGRCQTIKCCDILDNCETIIQYDTKFGAVYIAEKIFIVDQMMVADKAVWEYTMATLRAHVAKLKALGHEFKEFKPVPGIFPDKISDTFGR